MFLNKTDISDNPQRVNPVRTLHFLTNDLSPYGSFQPHDQSHPQWPKGHRLPSGPTHKNSEYICENKQVKSSFYFYLFQDIKGIQTDYWKVWFCFFAVKVDAESNRRPCERKISDDGIHHMRFRQVASHITTLIPESLWTSKSEQWHGKGVFSNIIPQSMCGRPYWAGEGRDLSHLRIKANQLQTRSRKGLINICFFFSSWNHFVLSFFTFISLLATVRK